MHTLYLSNAACFVVGTQLSLCCSVVNAALCGSNINRPYNALIRWWCLSGSSNCKRKSEQNEQSQSLSYLCKTFTHHMRCYLQTKTGDSKSWTSLSISDNIAALTLISPLNKASWSKSDTHQTPRRYAIQFANEIAGMLVGLGEKADGHSSNWVVAPRVIECTKQINTILPQKRDSLSHTHRILNCQWIATHFCFQVSQFIPQLEQLDRSHQDHVEIFYHSRCKFQILLLQQDLCKSAVDILRIKQ